MLDRYDRQVRLPEIGKLGQDKLKNASILCVGAGGLGSPALLYLAAAGVGRIGVIDFDRVDASNLQRQVLFDTGSVGQPKALQAALRLQAFNPTIDVQAYDEALNVESATRLFPQYDLILDGSDNFDTKFLINDAAVKFGKPWIYGAIQGFDGQVSVFNYQGGPCYRCLYPDKPKGRIMNCAEAGVIGAVAGMIGMTQALQAIQVIVGHDSFEILSGQIWMIDMRSMQTRMLGLKKSHDCPVCSINPQDIQLTYQTSACAIIPEIEVIDLSLETQALLFDVREAEEWDRGHIPQAKLWPLSKIMQGAVPDVPRDASIILHCQKGVRSLQAGTLLQQAGFSNVRSLAGGYEAWAEKIARS
jgi:molybdopterin/thiamine biosynthesis adenylyltransferase/rhodanese-related sulfurtransferase